MHKFDLARARQQTRGCEQVLHFNNAGSSLMPTPVADTLYRYLQQEEQIGGYETAAAEGELLQNFYTALGTLLNCKVSEIAYIENATRAWDMAFYSLGFEPGDRILTTLWEYRSNVIAYLQQAKRYGLELVFVPNDVHGQIDLEALRNLINHRTKLISISHVPTGGGVVNPAAEVGRIAKEHGILYLLDACQSVGQMPVDVQAIGCDMLSGTGRKYLRGPRGTGFLYVREELANCLEPPLLDLHAAELTSRSTYRLEPGATRFENWEQYFAGKAALGVAADYALGWGLENIQHRVYALADLLRRKLAELDGVEVTDQGQERCGIVTFRASKPADQIKAELSQHRINVTTSSASGVLEAFEGHLGTLVRASLHYYNSEGEVERFVEVLESILLR